MYLLHATVHTRIHTTLMTVTVCQYYYWESEIGEFLTTFKLHCAMRISGITVVSSIAIPETVSLSSLQFQVSKNTILYTRYILLHHFLQQHTQSNPLVTALQSTTNHMSTKPRPQFSRRRHQKVLKVPWDQGPQATSQVC